MKLVKKSEEEDDEFTYEFVGQETVLYYLHDNVIAFRNKRRVVCCENYYGHWAERYFRWISAKNRRVEMSQFMSELNKIVNIYEYVS